MKTRSVASSRLELLLTREQGAAGVGESVAGTIRRGPKDADAVITSAVATQARNLNRLIVVLLRISSLNLHGVSHAASGMRTARHCCCALLPLGRGFIQLGYPRHPQAHADDHQGHHC